MVEKVRLSAPTLKVLKFLLERPANGQSGAEISKFAGVGSGTMYPLLARLEAAGWCESVWEPIDPSEAGRPRRRLYTLTVAGRARARAAFAEFSVAPDGDLAWHS
ncbi:PadR family transcriptional regulator [Lichenifustis flavocetrariae]|uniref:PadR family transcriptional regulator n=1 Tax=Lichenifustis flavocetrariae TaxID=2949735 RepID=UPI003D0FA799